GPSQVAARHRGDEDRRQRRQARYGRRPRQRRRSHPDRVAEDDVASDDDPGRGIYEAGSAPNRGALPGRRKMTLGRTMRLLHLLIALSAILATPTFAWTDVPPPPAIERGDTRCEKLNEILLRLARQEGVPVTLVYTNIGFVEILIPKTHEAAAA